jgi:arginase
LATFLKRPMKRIQIVKVMSEIGAGTRGASLGFQALEVAALSREEHVFKRLPISEIETENQLLYDEIETPTAKRIRGIGLLYERLEKEVSYQLSDKAFPLVIAGDHSAAGGTIAGVKKAFPTSRLGVIWIDAHADLHSPYSTPSGNVHGMPMATALALDNTSFKINEVKGITLEWWNKLKGPEPRLKPEDLVFIAVRSTEQAEDEIIKQNNIRNITVEELRKKGIDKAAEEAIELLSNCDHIYVSFDVDSMDSSISLGTGTPVPGGLWKEEALKLMVELAKNPKVCCMEIVEINPCLDDKRNVMAETALDILLAVEEVLKERLGK